MTPDSRNVPIRRSRPIYRAMHGLINQAATRACNDEILIRMLKENQDEYLSGEDIAQRMKVSRTAVWNHIQGLRLLGYDVEAVPHRGYRLTALPERLLPDEIKDGLKTKRFGKQITVYEKLGSTNDAAVLAAHSGVPEGSAIFAEFQSKGRGRLGRHWHAPAGKALLFSLVLRPKLPMASTPRITLAAAVGAAKALGDATGLSIQIKWPNDVYLDGKKLGGILTQIDTDLESIRYAVLGIGINVNLERADFPADLRERATSLKCVLGHEVDRNALARCLLEKLEVCYDMLMAGDFQGIRSEWSAMSITTGRWVEIQTQQRRGSSSRLEGTAQGVDDNGCLIIRKENGLTEHVISGDVVLKD